MATSAEQEQEGFWEELEKQFDRQIPIKDEVRYALDTVFKRLDVFDPEEREGVINAAEHIAYEIVTAAFRGDVEEVQEEVIKNMSKEDKEKAVQGGSKKVFTKHGYDITPGTFLEMFKGVKKLPKKCKQKEAPRRKKSEKAYNLIYGRIYRDILESFYEEKKSQIFNETENFEDFLKKEEIQEINSRYPVDTETLEFYGLEIDGKCVMMVSEPSDVTYLDEFSKEKKKLIKKATKMIHLILKRRWNDRDPILSESEKEELTRKIDVINYPTSPGNYLGLFVNYGAYNKWKEEKSKHELQLFNECVKKVRERLCELPDLVEQWGNWACDVYEVLKSEGPSSQ